MTSDSVIERPDSPGLWTREGKFYLGYRDSLYVEPVFVVDNGHGQLDRCSIADLPIGNWRKLTAEPASEKGEEVDDDDESVDERIFDIEGRVWMQSRGRPNGYLAWPEDAAEYIQAGSWYMKAVPTSSPEVIEGKGQAVPRPGVYAWDDEHGNTFAEVWDAEDKLQEGVRYIYVGPLPTFPPREPFTAPPRPELQFKLYEVTQGADKDKRFWGVPYGDGAELVVDGKLEYSNSSWFREIHPTTGKPIKE
jgi:hypothetical protein